MSEHISGPIARIMATIGRNYDAGSPCSTCNVYDCARECSALRRYRQANEPEPELPQDRFSRAIRKARGGPPPPPMQRGYA
jgi:hypothetical protein